MLQLGLGLGWLANSLHSVDDIARPPRALDSTSCRWPSRPWMTSVLRCRAGVRVKVRVRFRVRVRVRARVRVCV